jgi:hypothetical protein
MCLLALSMKAKVAPQAAFPRAPGRDNADRHSWFASLEAERSEHATAGLDTPLSIVPATRKTLLAAALLLILRSSRKVSSCILMNQGAVLSILWEKHN